MIFVIKFMYTYYSTGFCVETIGRPTAPGYLVNPLL